MNTDIPGHTHIYTHTYVSRSLSFFFFFFFFFGSDIHTNINTLNFTDNIRVLHTNV